MAVKGGSEQHDAQVTVAITFPYAQARQTIYHAFLHIWRELMWQRVYATGQTSTAVHRSTGSQEVVRMPSIRVLETSPEL